MIREGTANDISRLAEIHLASLQGDLLPRLGRVFLEKRFYPSVLTSSNALLLVDEDECSLNSYVVFAYNSGKFVEDITSHKISIGLSILRKLLSDPSVLLQVIAAMRSNIVLTTQVDHLERQPELYLMATDPRYQSTGIGSRLVQDGIERLRQAGYQSCWVRTSSDRAKQFYQRLGFEVIGKEFRGQRLLHLLYTEMK